MSEQNNKSKTHSRESDIVTRRMFIKGVATSFGALPVFAWPRWAQAFYYNLGFFKKSTAPSTYVEDVFSTYLYTGDNTARTIANGIDLAGKGGLVWIKMRSASSSIHCLYDSARGFATDKTLDSSANNGQFNLTPSGLSGALANGFNIGTHAYINTTSMHGGSPGPQNYASWTFRKAEKFLDVVTYTGDGSGMKTVNHSLGITPGMVIIKRVDGASDWVVWHRSLTLTGNTQGLKFNGTDAFGTPSGGGTVWYTTSPMTATTMSVGSSQAGDWNTNSSGGTYVAYLFAHDAAADGLIQCGTYTGSGGVDSVTLGWEPQFVLMKGTAAGTQWSIEDIMREMSHSGQKQLQPNSSGSELGQSAYVIPNATGFTVNSGYYGTGTQVIYVAIRRPMKKPTVGTQVFNALAYNSGTPVTLDVGFSADLVITVRRSNGMEIEVLDRLRGFGLALQTNTAAADGGRTYLTQSTSTTFTGVASGPNYAAISDTGGNINWWFKRAPSFLDIVCYTGDGNSTHVISHSLGVAPRLVILKRRTALGSFNGDWYVYSFHNNFSSPSTLNSTNIFDRTGGGSLTNVGNSSFTISGATVGNQVNDTHVAYLFGTCTDVSKVDSYIGNGASQIINCGFTTGARFILIKRTDSAGDWFVWDTARGITTGNDPHLSLNTTTAEVTTDDSVDPDNSGFIVNQVSATNINVNGASYIFMAIA